MRKILATLFAVGIAVMLLPSAWAAVCSDTAGTTISMAACAGVAPGSSGTEVFSTTQTLTDLSGAGGTLQDVSVTEQVWNTSTGNDFYFYVTNGNGTTSNTNIVTLSLSFYTGTLGLGYVNGSGAGAFDPLTGGLDTTNDVNFTFSGIGNSQTSSWLEINTTSTALEPGVVLALDSDAAKLGSPFMGEVPEPASTGVVAGALALMALVVRRRAAKKA